MDADEREQLEREARRLCDAGDHDGAATRALRGYGPEIFGFLIALHRSEQDASDVFAAFSENLWRALPTFGWECTLRTWAYTIARNASHRFRREGRKNRGNAPLSEFASHIAEQVRSETAAHLRTENKNEIARLRESLSSEEQTLLILRVDKGLAWDELARVLHDASEPLSDEERKKEAARLRKRFQAVKEKLVALGTRRGLIKPHR